MREVFRLHLDRPLPAPVLAAGGDLKCSLGVGTGRNVVLYESIGDLELVENRDAFEKSFHRLLGEFSDSSPLLVCDKHPAYVSSGCCRRIAKERGLRLVEVQHHRAHVAAVAAEASLLDRPIVGLAFDGTGFGDDGTIWGGEFFVGQAPADLRRQASFAPLTLCGGDAAVRKPWRIALAWLIENGVDDGKIRAWAERVGVSLPDLGLFRQSLDRGLNCVKTTALGRWFDCFSALLGVRTEIEFEAQAAIDLQKAAESYDGGCFVGPATVRWMGDDLATITFEDFLEALDYMLVDWSPKHAAAFARQFHVSVAEAVADVAAQFARLTGAEHVLCSGGCFLYALLSDMLKARLKQGGLRQVMPKALPPGDQALALGQIVLSENG